FSPANPHLSHLVNILLYGLTGFLLYVTFRKLLSDYASIYWFFICLFFIAHPVHTEVVANIKSRDEMLSFFFSIATVFYLADHIRNNSFGKLLAALACFFLA